MLEIQETGSTGFLKARTYRCMACSATFPGLSSLLVHQASHANNSISPNGNQLPPPLHFSCNSCRTMFSSKDLLDQHHCNNVSISASSSIYICECGKEFQDFNIMLEHKILHSTQMDIQVPLATEKANALEVSVNSLSHSDPKDTSSSENLNLASDSTSAACVLPPCHQFPQLTSEKSEVSEAGKMEIFTNAPSPVPQFNMSLLKQVAPIPDSKPLGLISSPSLKTSRNDLPHTSYDETSISDSSTPVSNVGLQNKHQDVKFPKGTLKKMLVSAFMERLPLAQAARRESNAEISEPFLSPSATVPESLKGSSISQLRRLLNKSRSRKNAGCTNPLKGVGKTVNLANTYLPVVALETRQKLLGVTEDGQDCQHQCRLCQRIFHSMDKLISHHALHKKETVRGCSRCKRLLISKTAIQFHRPCHPEPKGSLQDPFSVGHVVPAFSGNLAVPGQKGTVESSPVKQLQKKTFYCHRCKHSYTRLYNLKKHRCNLLFHQHKESNYQKDKVHIVNEKKEEREESLVHENVSVGTETTSLIKRERVELEYPQGPEGSLSMLAENPSINLNVWPGSPKSFMPFTHKTVKQLSTPKQELELESLGASMQNYSVTKHMEWDETEGEVENKEVEEVKRQWTMPIDESDGDHLVEAEHSNKKDLDCGKPTSVNGATSTSSPLNHPSHISEVGQSHSACRGVQQHIHNPLSIKAKSQLEIKERFDCLKCGKYFSRKDTLTQHKKKCVPVKKNMEDPCSSSEIKIGKNRRMIVPGHCQGTTQEQMLILIPSAGVQDNSTDGNHASGGTWGIMSLPSVLPRKVTCECGSVFTCSHLLFEHLQMHVQESYICPQCGKNYHSWPSYETHLRTHKPIVCPKCPQSFSLRSSLIRHLSKNRCKADSTKEDKFVCSTCSLEFLSYSSLNLHMQNCVSKPPQKHIRCPVCVHSFSSVRDLQRHLITHSQPHGFRCHICQRSYPSLRSLKDHRRKVHRIMSVKS